MNASAAAVILGGLAIAGGAGLPWAAFNDPLSSTVFSSSGFELGYGRVTAVLGLVLAVLGLRAARRDLSSRIIASAASMAAVVMIVVSAAIVDLCVRGSYPSFPSIRFLEPDLGGPTTGLGAGLVLAACWRLWRRKALDRSSAQKGT
jgi:hypothetical protein